MRSEGKRRRIPTLARLIADARVVRAPSIRGSSSRATREETANGAVPIPESAAHPPVYNPFFQPADGERAGDPVSSRGKKNEGKERRKKRSATQRGYGEEREREGRREEGGRKGENRAHVRSPQAERVKGRDANGKTSVENVGGRVRELGKGGRGTRLEDRQTRGGVPLRSAPRRARLLSDNANQLSHFNVLFPLFQAARGCCQ